MLTYTQAMGDPISIMFNLEGVGSLSFVAPPANGLNAQRTAGGFRLAIPARLTFQYPTSQSRLVLENLRAVFSAEGTEIGVAIASQEYQTPVREMPIILLWNWTLQEFSFYEAKRRGKEPHFRMIVSGQIRYILPGEQGKEAISLPTMFSGQGDVGYSREVWTTMLRQLNLRDAVVVEIPFSSEPSTAWEAIWDALRDARNAFDKGGTTGWKSCVANVRHALELWQEAEPVNFGPGWQRPKHDELRERNKDQRIDNLRWHLHQCAHLAPHTKADSWTREDALLALSTLAALLCVRDP